MSDPDDKTRYQHHFIVVGTVDNEGNMTFTIDEGSIENRFNEGPIWDNYGDEWIDYPITKPLDKPSSDPLAIDARDLLTDLCERLEVDYKAMGWILGDDNG
jgi:hypothetical protein